MFEKFNKLGKGDFKKSKSFEDFQASKDLLSKKNFHDSKTLLYAKSTAD